MNVQPLNFSNDLRSFRMCSPVHTLRFRLISGDDEEFLDTGSCDAIIDDEVFKCDGLSEGDITWPDAVGLASPIAGIVVAGSSCLLEFSVCRLDRAIDEIGRAHV